MIEQLKEDSSVSTTSRPAAPAARSPVGERSQVVAAPVPSQALLAALIRPLIDQIEHPLIVCDSLGRPILMNNAAQGELSRGERLRMDAGLLKARDDAQTRLLGLAIRHAVVDGRRQMLALGAQREHSYALVMPLATGDADAEFALVMLGSRHVCSELALQMFATLHALTPCERRVLKGLVAGHRPNTLAEELGVEISTVRTQISAIRSKIGVNSIDDLLRLTARLPSTTAVIDFQAAGTH